MKIKNNMGGGQPWRGGGGNQLKSRKAFTLIELLAVIVILAIIALIAIPIVLNIVEDTKKSATIRSAEMYVHGIEIDVINQQLNKKEIEDGQYNVIEFNNIEANGEKPSDGMIEILEGKVIDYSLQIGNYIVNYDKENKKSIISEELRKAEPNVYLIEGMIPIQYKDNNWIVVDPSKRDWYNYNKQEWANAVILNQGITKNIGDIVDVSNEVKAMLVYIPRYEYKIEGQYGKGGTSTSVPGEIEVNFITKEKTVGSEGYRIHPAFTFGSEELNGIWVGKFETTGTGDNPTILPSVTSLRNQSVSEQFETSLKFNEFLTNGDSHMAKNSEWGAVAYLSQSKYGKYGNSSYSGVEKQVMINNCSSFKTGIGADSQNASSSSTTCTTNTYETSKGQAASTTGNITGIYDMSGGAWEYVMGVLLGNDKKPISGYNTSSNSGYTGALSSGTYTGKEWPEEKYYDTYISTNSSSYDASLSTTACNGGVCYGQALSETSSWYGDCAKFIYSRYPWLRRSGRYADGSIAGIFYFDYSYGSSSSYISFRVVAF